MNTKYINFIAFSTVTIASISHVISINLYYETILEPNIYAFLYFGITIVIAVIFTFRKRNKIFKSLIKYFILYYIFCIIFFGGVISILFLAPNYFLAEKKYGKFIKSDILKVAFTNDSYEKFSKRSYIVVKILNIKKEIYFHRKYYKELKLGRYVDIKYYKGFFGTNIIDKVTVYDNMNHEIISKNE